jgi:pimeloyl-ACP methyl ester carboxylesterase
MTTFLRHGAVELALHTLKAGGDGAAGDGANGDGAYGDGARRPLLLLHGLGERSPGALPPQYASWPGPVHALDFTGHGVSTVPVAGGYTAEILMGDADVALAALGPLTVAGRGLGAYVALLLAGARPDGVRGAIVLDGPGLAGGGATPASPSVATVDPNAVVPPDPWALAELTRDPRPPDYATTFVRQAVSFSGLERPVAVCAVGRPSWVDAVLHEPGVARIDLAGALALYASV